jgi:arylsulfatase A-like enzyme/Flp pilus assembly protein TadD
MKHALLCVLALGLALPLFSGSVLLVTLDTTRADHLSLYGYGQNTSPRLSAYAQKGRIFRRAYASVPLTLPAHYTILTGRNPWDHGLWLNGQRVEPGGNYLPVLMKQKGYRTGAFVSSAILYRGWGLGRGFDVYDDALPSRSGDLRERSCADTTKAALEFIRGKDPYFVWVHYFEPHMPYAPPAPYDTKFPQRYDGEIAAMDACLGELLDAVGPETLVVIMGDHGEMLGEHGEAEHGVLLYQGVVHVPLVLRGPGVVQGASDVPVSLADIYPTLLSIAGLTIPQGLEGRDLSSGDPAPAPVKAASIYGREVYGYLPSLAVVDGAYKLLAYGERDYRLFNLKQDASEKQNLFLKEQRLSRRMKTLVREIRLPDTLSVSLTEEQKKTLESLGYLAPAPQPSVLIAPEEGLKTEALLREAKERWSMFDLPGAAEKAREVLAGNGRHTEAMNLLAKVRMQQGRPGESAELFGRITALRPSDSYSHLYFGQALKASGEVEKGEREIRIALDMNPQLYDAYGDLAGILLARKDYAGLDALRAQAEAQTVEDPVLFQTLGQADLDRDRLDSAFTQFHRAMRLNPAASAPVRGLAFTSLRQEKKAQALVYFRQLLRLAPADPAANFAAGTLVYETGGNPNEALGLLRKALSGCSGALCDSVRAQLRRVEAGSP